MRHRKTGRKLNRNSPQRNSLMKNLAISIIEHESVSTTLAKAKEIRGFLEPLITLAKQDGAARRKLVFSRVRDKKAVGKLFEELGPRYKDRPGGYLRILKTGFRSGDSAPMALVQLLDQPEDSPT